MEDNETEVVENVEVEITETEPEQTQETKTFTQQQVNRVVAKEKKKIQQQYSDYETIKQENEQLKTKVKEVSNEAKTVEQKLKEEKSTQSIEKAIADFSTITDPKLAKKLLTPDKFVVADDGTVTNVGDLLQDLIKEHPILTKKTVPDNSVPNTQQERKKYSLVPNYNSSFFSGGGVKQVEMPLTITGNN